MRRDDLYHVGEQIQTILQDAIDSQNFKELNSKVYDVVGGAMDTVKESMSQAVDMGRQKTQEVYRRSYAGTAARPAKRPAREIYVKHPAGEISGPALFITGLIMSIFMGIIWISVTITWLFIGLNPGVVTAIILLGLMFIACLFMTGAGQRLRKRAKRFKKYIRIIDGREYCEIRELSEKTGESESLVVKQLESMIHHRFFLQARLDQQKTCLILTNDMYRNYEEAQRALRERQQAEQMAREKAPELDRECRDILEEGRRFIRHIHACNDAIPGEEISQKISRMEVIVDRIFKEVEKYPDLAPDLHKFMTYYLPTTQKLLDAYQEMDAQPVEGKNIRETKREIEKTMDTINEAFENLLDSFYRERAWDISTDISVLQTMLANEGLTKDDMARSMGETGEK